MPAQLKIHGNWISVQEVAITLTISPPETDKLLFNAESKVDKLRVSETDTMQYAYVGQLSVKKYGKFNVLSLLAHEMAHLWNAQHWRCENTSPVWMHEGGANYFARKALLDFGYVSVDEAAAYYNTQSEKCIRALNKGPIKNEAATIENALQKGSGYEFEALIKKYIGQNGHKKARTIGPGIKLRERKNFQ